MVDGCHKEVEHKEDAHRKADVEAGNDTGRKEDHIHQRLLLMDKAFESDQDEGDIDQGVRPHRLGEERKHVGAGTVGHTRCDQIGRTAAELVLQIAQCRTGAASHFQQTDPVDGADHFAERNNFKQEQENAVAVIGVLCKDVVAQCAVPGIEQLGERIGIRLFHIHGEILSPQIHAENGVFAEGHDLLGGIGDQTDAQGNHKGKDIGQNQSACFQCLFFGDAFHNMPLFT